MSDDNPYLGAQLEEHACSPARRYVHELHEAIGLFLRQDDVYVSIPPKMYLEQLVDFLKRTVLFSADIDLSALVAGYENLDRDGHWDRPKWLDERPPVFLENGRRRTHWPPNPFIFRSSQSLKDF